jgi:hypothetical protein
MDYKEQKRKYPILAVRMKPDEMKYLRRESDEKAMKLSQYVKAMLFPFGLPSEK